MGQDDVGRVHVGRDDLLDFGVGAVPGEMLGDVGAWDFPALGPTMTTSTAFARSSSGMASPMARAAPRLPSQQTMMRASFTPPR